MVVCRVVFRKDMGP